MGPGSQVERKMRPDLTRIVPTRRPSATNLLGMNEMSLGRASISRLTAVQVADALALARSTHLVWAQRAGLYGANALGMHEVGKLGEFGAADWFEIRGYDVRRRFRGENHDADVLAACPERTLRVEVKSWSSQVWQVWVQKGRMVSGKQLDALIGKADLIVWCRVPELSEDREIVLEGWTAVRDVVAFGEPLWWPRYIPQLQLDDRFLRPMRELADPANFPALTEPTRRPSSCGHPLHHGICWACVPFADPEPPARVRVAAGRRYFHHGDTAKLKGAHGGWPFRELPELLATHAAARRRINPCPRCFSQAHDFGPD
jgi:hypothetical protein